MSSNDVETPVKKKRGRKKGQPNKPKTTVVDVEKPPPKKRGRKPKGGKIVTKEEIMNSVINESPNIILHLKCSLNDINALNTDNVKAFDINKTTLDIENNISIEKTTETFNMNNSITDINHDNDCDNKKDLWNKINNLKLQLHTNNIQDKRSACFWCTCKFDSPPIYIPRHELNGVYDVYGCFCTPECGAAFLMNEKIDTSVKFERYYLLNNIYGKIFEYEKNIKPAPNPYYLLDKYYGNLSIHEYRKLLKNNQLLIVVDKPLSHVLPELIEDNTDFMLNKRIIPNNNNVKYKKTNNVMSKLNMQIKN